MHRYSEKKATIEFTMTTNSIDKYMNEHFLRILRIEGEVARSEEKSICLRWKE